MKDNINLYSSRSTPGPRNLNVSQVSKIVRYFYQITQPFQQNDVYCDMSNIELVSKINTSFVSTDNFHSILFMKSRSLKFLKDENVYLAPNFRRTGVRNYIRAQKRSFDL